MVEGNSKVRCHTSDLVSTIGRITHIISDKTGTLTKNKMTFRAVGLEDWIIGGNGELKIKIPKGSVINGGNRVNEEVIFNK